MDNEWNIKKKFHIQRDAPEKYNYLIGRNKWATAGMC